jgi:hypothetical protein
MDHVEVWDVGFIVRINDRVLIKMQILNVMEEK